jgi:hypothetical protein
MSMHLQHRPNLIGTVAMRSLLVALLSLAGAGIAAAAASPLPPLVDPASQEHHVGKVVFVELVIPDLTAAKQFYGCLAGPSATFKPAIPSTQQRFWRTARLRA